MSTFAQLSGFSGLTGIEDTASYLFSVNRDIPTPPASKLEHLALMDYGDPVALTGASVEIVWRAANDSYMM